MFRPHIIRNQIGCAITEFAEFANGYNLFVQVGGIDVAIATLRMGDAAAATHVLISEIVCTCLLTSL